MASGVVEKDFERRMLTNAAKTAAFTIRLKELELTIGNILLPTMNDLMGAFSPLAQSMWIFANAHPGLVGGAIKVTAAFIAAGGGDRGTIRLYLPKAAFLGIAGPALAAVAAIGRLASLAVVAGAIRPLVPTLGALRGALIGLAVIGAAGGLRTALMAMAAGALRLLNPLRLLPAAIGLVAVAMRGPGAAMLMIPAPAALLAIGAAGAFIWNDCKGLGKFFSSFFSTLKTNLDSMVGGRFKGLSDAVSRISEIWQRWTGEISDKSWSEAGVSPGNSVASAIRSIADAIDAVMQKWESFKSAWNAVQDVLQMPVGKAVQSALGGDRATHGRAGLSPAAREKLGIPVIGKVPPKLEPAPPEQRVNRPFNCRLLSSTRMAALSKAVALAPSILDGVVEMGRERPAIR